MNAEKLLKAIQDTVDAAHQKGVRVTVTLENSTGGFFPGCVDSERVTITADRHAGIGSLASPGKFDCLKKLQENPDMPYLVLLASDKLWGKTVRDYGTRLSLLSPKSADKAAECFELAGRGEAWQQLHPNMVKVAD